MMNPNVLLDFQNSALIRMIGRKLFKTKFSPLKLLKVKLKMRSKKILIKNNYHLTKTLEKE